MTQTGMQGVLVGLEDEKDFEKIQSFFKKIATMELEDIVATQRATDLYLKLNYEFQGDKALTEKRENIAESINLALRNRLRVIYRRDIPFDQRFYEYKEAIIGTFGKDVWDEVTRR